MPADSQDAAFRAQLVVAEQAHLYERWLSWREGDRVPLRRRFRPADFPRLLPDISLVETIGGKARFRVRLAGTRVRDIYEREITGLELSAFENGSSLTYWQQVYEEVVATGRPAQGVIRAPRRARNHLVQFWLRLPISSNGSGADLILCHDMCMPVAELPADTMVAAIAGSAAVR